VTVTPLPGHLTSPDPTPSPRSPLAVSRRSLVLGAGATASAVAGSAALPSLPASAAGRRPMTRLTMTAHGIVQRRGTTFRRGGVNAFHLVTNDYPSPHLMRHAQIDALLLKAHRMRARFVRAHTLAASVGKPHTLVTGVSGTGPSPRISYDPAVWEAIEHAAWRARQLGIYLIPPFVDELGYYHGGKRQWVDFRRPGSVSLDPAVKAANSPRQREAENAFYHDRQITWDFEQYLRDWLRHVNPRTGVAFGEDPVFSVVQVGNELWTAAQDAPGWIAEKAALIKQVAPGTLVMDSGADGLRVQDMAWDSRHVDILETHPYSTFGAAEVTSMARFAASKGKAFAVGEYPWSKPQARLVEAAVRRAPNAFTSALWSLHDNGDLHNAGAGYGIDDAAFYVPGKDVVQRRAVTRVVAHHRALAHDRGRGARR